MASGYVARWGNDENDGLSWLKAKRTTAGAKSASLSPIYAEGLITENTNGITVIGVGKCIIDGFLIAGTVPNIKYKNLTVKNQDLYIGFDAGYAENCFLEKCLRIGWTNTQYFTQCIFKNCTYQGMNNSGYNTKNTFYSNSREIIDVLNSPLLSDNIFCGHDLDIYGTTMLYSLFIDCKFKFRNGGLGFDETVYAYPSGATDDDKIQDLRDRMAVVYGGLSENYLIGCKYYSGSIDDIFININENNFYLVEGCVAANMNFDGQPIGAKPEGRANIYDDDYTSITNIDVNGKIVNQELDGSAQGNIIDLEKARNIISIFAIGNRSSRNGVEINPSVNLGAQISEGSNVLTDQTNYIVEGEPITLDDAGGTVRNVDDRFLAVDEGGGAGLGFTSASSLGFVRDIIIDKPIAIKIKCSKSSSDLSSVSHVNGYITLDLFTTPMVNVDSNGEPTYGNLDAGYDEGSAVGLFTRYIQDLPVIKANQIPA